MTRHWLALARAVGLAGCATSAAFRSGENAERLQDYDRAVLEYQRALQASPDNVDYRRALDEAAGDEVSDGDAGSDASGA